MHFDPEGQWLPRTVTEAPFCKQKKEAAEMVTWKIYHGRQTHRLLFPTLQAGNISEFIIHCILKAT